ncbi:MAG: hypothetical protein GY929_02090 [Actinomycetia bacterium]|nr:hypothetical protein [Actinomycetes bacterium]
MTSGLSDGAPAAPSGRSESRSPLVAVAVTWLAGMVLFALIKGQSRVPAGYLTRDPQTTTEEAWYLGLASSLGAVGWAVAAAVMGFGAILARTWAAPRSSVRLLAAGSMITTVLLLDDILLIHDDILFRALGSERPTLVAYGIAFIAWLLAARSRFDRRATGPLLATLAGFTGSLAVDQVWHSDSDWRLVVEDGAKFVGIWSWAVFSVVFTLDQLKSEPETPRWNP